MKRVSLDTILQTERLTLRRPQETDVAFIFDATRYPGFNDGMLWDPPESLEDCLAPYYEAIKAWEAGERYLFTMTLKAGGSPVGRVALEERDYGTSVGYWTHPAYQNYGYMTEALVEVVRFAFGSLGIPSLEARHADWNLASRRVLEKCGFRFRKRIVQGFLKRGEWVPEDVLMLSRNDWLKRLDFVRG